MKSRGLIAYYESQLREIEADPVLIGFMRPLIFIHFFTALFWQRQGFAAILQETFASYCWPFFTSCDGVKEFLAPVASAALPFYLFVMAVATLTPRQKVRRVWWLLLFLEFLKLAYESLDYRFMGNYHFMPHVVTLVFLFLPSKRFWIKTWIVSFYFAAATLKLNFEWLSGASLSWKVPFHETALLPYEAFAALLTEVVAPQLLLFSQARLRKTGLALLCLFHAVSFYWVGFFYPSVMLCLLSFFVLENPHVVSKQNSWRWTFLPGFSLWVLFVVAQMTAMTHAREYALDGAKRILSLNMFDARSRCFGHFLIHRGSSQVEVAFKNEDLAVRVKCDPVIFFEQARHLCQGRENPADLIEARLVSKQFSDQTSLELVQEGDVCRRFQ